MQPMFKTSLYTVLWMSFLVLGIQSCKDEETAAPTEQTTMETPQQEIPNIRFQVVRTTPHDTNAFTEGLFIHNNMFFESTGATDQLPQTRSLFGILDTTSGKIKVKAELDKNTFFGEGIAMLNNKIYQLTYTTKIGFIYDATTYKKLGEFTIPSAEGWGMTTDGTYLIMSDGTNKLTYLDPNNLQVVKIIAVTENGYARDMLNELEFVDGFIYANIYTTTRIVKINVASGEVVGNMDLTTLAFEAKQTYAGSLELNGIAYDANSKLFYVTGKMWPKVYGIQL